MEMPVELYQSKHYLRRNELVLRHRTMVIKEAIYMYSRLLTCHPAQMDQTYQ